MLIASINLDASFMDVQMKICEFFLYLRIELVLSITHKILKLNEAGLTNVTNLQSKF